MRNHNYDVNTLFLKWIYSITENIGLHWYRIILYGFNEKANLFRDYSMLLDSARPFQLPSEGCNVLLGEIQSTSDSLIGWKLIAKNLAPPL